LTSSNAVVAARYNPHADAELKLMGQSSSTADLPPALAKAVQHWIGVVEAAPAGTGQAVMRVAAEAVMILQRRLVMTPDLERTFAEARFAADELGISLDRDGIEVSQPRANALAALDGLIMLLREARLRREGKDD
jgi:hypothetical protein